MNPDTVKDAIEREFIRLFAKLVSPIAPHLPKNSGETSKIPAFRFASPENSSAFQNECQKIISNTPEILEVVSKLSDTKRKQIIERLKDHQHDYHSCLKLRLFDLQKLTDILYCYWKEGRTPEDDFAVKYLQNGVLSYEYPSYFYLFSVDGEYGKCMINGIIEVSRAALDVVSTKYKAEKHTPSGHALPIKKDTLANELFVKKWEDIEVVFLSEQRIQLKITGQQESPTMNYTEMGFEDRRKKTPKLAWETFKDLAQKDGTISLAKVGATEQRKIEKRIQEIRMILRNILNYCDGDPIPFCKGEGYKAAFKISCGNSFES